MRYIVSDNLTGKDVSAAGKAYLLRDGWDDWYKFQTLFALVIFDYEGVRHDIGQLKIGQASLKPARTTEPGQRSPELPDTFEVLDDQFFSLGQDESYYETLWSLGDELAAAVLVALRDCALSLDIFKAARNEEVMSESLLRSVPASNVTGKLHRLATGNAKLTSFHFEYQMAETGLEFSSPNLEFKVTPNVEPPTNVHVIIGRNGSGKTSLLQSLAKATLNPGAPADDVGSLTLHEGEDEADSWAFASLVYVSFSVFDDFTLPPSRAAKLRAAQVSLRGEKSAKVADTTGKPTKAGRDLFINSLATCRLGSRRGRWREAIKELESDPLFEEADFGSLLEEADDEWRETAGSLFEKLSSGHAVVLLTITKLVELVDEKTLVLMDEPEGHLHPPLLSALIRSLSDLLIKRNGVAIIATHSPVILQEVPTSCVWKLERSGGIVVAERPRIETFGENVGTLTSEVFRLEVTAAGFHKLLTDAVREEGGDYEDILNRFGHQLGAEARAIVRGLAAIYRAKEGEL
jgi:predicted ATPase